MFKKLSLLISGAVLLSGLSFAQVFEIETNPVEAETPGVTPYVPGDLSGHAFVLMETSVKNVSSDSVTITWTNLSDSTEAPEGWLLAGVCDNITCRAEYGSWYYGSPEVSAPIAADSSMPLQLHVYASTDDPDGTGTYKIKLETLGQADTAVFLLTKKSTGVTVVALDDNRVSIYPNPVTSGSALNVFINKNLKASRATIYNIIGRKQMAFPVDKEVNTYDINSLVPGIYMLRLTDANGKVITSRKFAKH